MTTIQAIKESAKHINLWRKIYNMLCRTCKQHMFQDMIKIKDMGNEACFTKMQEILDKKLCLACRNRKALIVKNYKGKK